MSASLAVQGREFSLVERAEQERILAGWGDVLGGFCSERGTVSRVRVTEWAAPSGVGEHERFLAAHARPTNQAARAAYEALLAQAGPRIVSHEVLATITVELRKIRSGRRGERLTGLRPRPTRRCGDAVGPGGWPAGGGGCGRRLGRFVGSGRA